MLLLIVIIIVVVFAVHVVVVDPRYLHLKFGKKRVELGCDNRVAKPNLHIFGHSYSKNYRNGPPKWQTWS